MRQACPDPSCLPPTMEDEIRTRKRRDNRSAWQDTLGITEKAQCGLTVYRGRVYCSRAQAPHLKVLPSLFIIF